jgi:hypothetical protein
MADIVRCAGQSFLEHSHRWINWQHQKVLLAIARCRTAALGGHRDRCTGCGHTTTISYNSCRNRHCPRCQGNARRRWLQARERELLPTRYVHAVFTLPRELAPLALQNKRLIYNLLFHASAETLLEIARDRRHLGAEIGFFSVLHSWNQRLQFHPHIHCVIAAGGLAPDHSSWISARRSFFLPIGVLSRVFRGKFVAGLRNAFQRGELQFHGSLLPLAQPRAFAAWLRVLFRHDWVVYSKRPFGGPEHVLRYLGAYTHRRHLELQADRSLQGQRHLPLAGFSPWQQEEAHDPGCRRVPAPLPSPSAAAGIRAHPQLRLPCQPQPRHSPAALLPTAGRRGEDNCFRDFTVHQPGSLPLELSSLRRNHARRRTVLRRSTPTSLTTATRPVRCMNHCSHLRPLPALRRTRRSLALTGKNSSATGRLNRPLTPLCEASKPGSRIQAADRTHHSQFMHPLDSLDPIQNT